MLGIACLCRSSATHANERITSRSFRNSWMNERMIEGLPQTQAKPPLPASGSRGWPRSPTHFRSSLLFMMSHFPPICLKIGQPLLRGSEWRGFPPALDKMHFPPLGRHGNEGSTFPESASRWSKFTQSILLLPCSLWPPPHHLTHPIVYMFVSGIAEWAMWFQKHTQPPLYPIAPITMGFPGSSAGKESTCNARTTRFYPWVGKIPLEKG